jgi:hypothetical protein
MFRIQITEGDPANPDRIVGDTGLIPIENTVTIQGKKLYLCDPLGGTPLAIGFASIGSGNTILTSDTALSGEFVNASKRASVVYTNNGSSQAQFAFTLASSNSFYTQAGATTMQDVGLFASNTLGTMFCGGTYASSQLSSNQNVVCSAYNINFG